MNIITANRINTGHIFLNPIKALTIISCLLLPYVFIEPAPVDIFFMFFTIYIIFNLKIPSISLVIFLTYIFFTLFSTVIGLSLGLSETYKVLEYFLIEFYLASLLLAISSVTLQKEYFVDFFLKWYIYGAFFSCFIVLLIKFGPDNLSLIYRDDFRIRVKGFFKDPNVLAPFLILPIIAVLFSEIIKSKFTRLMIAVVCIFLLFLTFSRGGYASLVISIMYAITLILLKRSSIKTILTLLAIFLSSILIITWIMSTDIFQSADYLLSRFELKDYDSQRFFHIKNALEVGILNPLGTGPGSYGAVYNLNPHNLFAGKIVDAGLIPAIIITFLPVCAWIFTTFNFFKRNDNISLILSSSMIAQILASTVVYSHHWRHMLILAVISCAYSIRKP
tara:strand:+ start:9083 stop:10255 length:1173 start_codon:yes stop_codon:yes gene_type:complete